MSSELTSTGLSEKTIEKIRQVFIAHPDIERVCLYGSRAKGNYRNGSDIDLTIIGDVEHSQLLRIERELDDLLLPYEIDLSLFRQIESPALIEHIKRVGVEFYICDK